MEKKLNGHEANGDGALTGEPHSLAEGLTHESDEQVETETDGASDAPGLRNVEPPPGVIAELSDSCIRYLERALGVTLDYTAETLPLLDHYLAEAEKALVAQNEEDPQAAHATLPLLVHTSGAYFGEVVRRRYPAWWRVSGHDPMAYRLEFENVYLAFSPMLFIYEGLARGLALHGDQGIFDAAQFEMDEEDQKAAADRLSELSVSDDEYYAPSTRLEALDVVVDTIRTRRLATGDAVEMALTPEDYEI